MATRGDAMLDEEKILARANELYAEAKGPLREWNGIRSDQVKALLKALVEALNARVQF